MRYVLLILCKIANQINKAKSLDTPYPAAAFLATWLAVLCSSISTGHVDESALCMDNKCSACQISRGWSCTANYHGWSTSLSKTMFAACSALLRILAGLRAARRRWSCSHAEASHFVSVTENGGTTVSSLISTVLLAVWDLTGRSLPPHDTYTYPRIDPTNISWPMSCANQWIY